MTRTRKTIHVQELKEHVNMMLEKSKCSDDVRHGIARVMQHVLFETNNYRGFNYVEWLDGGFKAWKADGEPEDNTKYLGNQSRIRYY